MILPYQFELFLQGHNKQYLLHFQTHLITLHMLENCRP